MSGARELPVRLIDVGDNVRDVTDAGLVESIRRHGVLQAITVRRDGRRYRVVMGHRRLKAAKLVGLTTIPALVEDTIHDDQVLRQVAENVHRRGMDAMDVARALQAYLDAHPGVTKNELGVAMGFHSRYASVWVANKLALLRLDEETQGRIERGELNEHVAIKQRQRLNDGRGHPRVIPEYEHGNTASVEIGFDEGKVVLGVDRDAREVEVLLSDRSRRTVAITLSAHEAKLLGRRLTQAWEAVA
jgi:ParB/RepB/Spo0J family partition protein